MTEKITNEVPVAEIVSDADFISIIAERIGATTDDAEIALAKFGRNFRAIHFYLQRNRGCII